MIQANELRIGNFVLAGKMTEPITVSTIDYVIGDGYIINRSIPESHLSPILLNISTLEKCGFKAGKVKSVTRFVDDINDIDPADKKKWTYYWDLKVPENNHVEDLYNFSLVQWGKGTDIFWGHQQLKVKVSSLHQLQNLYYCLTGQELEYKP